MARHWRMRAPGVEPGRVSPQDPKSHPDAVRGNRIEWYWQVRRAPSSASDGHGVGRPMLPSHSFSHSHIAALIDALELARAEAAVWRGIAWTVLGLLGALTIGILWATRA